MSAPSILFSRNKVNFILLFLVTIAVTAFTTSFGWAKASSTLTVHFETNGRDLNAADKKKLKALFNASSFGSETKIIVVGYTDSTGKTNANYALSRMRAIAVKNFLIAQLKVDADQIIAVGRGSESPVSSNDTPENRALNRRAEIFTSGTPESMMIIARSEPSSPPPPPPPPDPKNYMDLLKEAQKLVKIGIWEDASIKLKRAQAKGADHHFLWHLLNGIIGYHHGLSPDILLSYFEKALQLEADNLDAIDFWGRAKARKYFESGIVRADMGRSVNSAIKVDTISQQYELMRLFQVEPLRHIRLPAQGIDVWQCRTTKMATINYFFDVSSSYYGEYYPIR